MNPEATFPTEKQSADVQEVTEDAQKNDETKLHFTLKFRDEIRAVDLTQEQIKSRLQILMSYQENEKEFWAGLDEIRPFLHVIRSPAFRRLLEDESRQNPDPEIFIDSVAPDDWTRVEKILKRQFKNGVPGSAARLILHRNRRPVGTQGGKN